MEQEILHKSSEMHDRFLKIAEKRKKNEMSRNLKGNEILERQTMSLSKARNIDEVFWETNSSI